MNYALSMLCDEYDNIVDEYILSLSPVDKGEDMAAEEVLTKKCLENKVWLTSNERHTMLEAMEEYSALRNHVPDVGKEVDQMTAQELKEIFNANAHEWVNNGYTNTRCMNMDEFVRTTYKMFQDRKVEIPSEEDVDKEFPITSQTKAVTLSYQANQMAKREGAKWAIEQIKHLNKL